MSRCISRQFTTSVTTSRSVKVLQDSNFTDFIKERHGYLIRTHQHTDSYSISDVIKCYALSSSSSINKARFAFLQIAQPTLPIWNFLIRGLSQSSQPDEAINMFNKMREQGYHGNNLTFIFTLKASAKVMDVISGKKVHDLAMKLGFESYLYVCNSLVFMYASCGALDLARQVFDEMSERDLVSWNSLICGYSQCNKFKDVLSLFDAMKAANVKADAVTMVKVLLACSHLSDWDMADSSVKYIVHNKVGIDVYLGNTLIDIYGRRGLVELAWAVFDNMSERNVVTWNSMIMGYSKAGNFKTARRLFDEMPIRDAISWTSIIVGCCQANLFSDAIRTFQEMMAAKVKPDEITVSSVLSACAHTGMLNVGKAVHEYVHQQGVKLDIYAGNALIDMYCKCGSVKMAMEVFHDMKEKDSVSWTSIISGTAVNGDYQDTLHLFNQMLSEGIKPTHGTLIGVLLACAHCGLVDKGLKYFESMERDYGLVPEMKHYGCIVDLLGRSGNLEKAYEFIQRMPVVADVVVWRILLGACKLHGNMFLAEIASINLLKLDPFNGGNYVLSSSTFATAQRWNDATKLREVVSTDDVQMKPLGWSCLEVNVATSDKSQKDKRSGK